LLISIQMSSSLYSEEVMFSKSIDDVDETSSENLTKDLFDQFDSSESSSSSSSNSTIRTSSESLKKYFKKTNWYYRSRPHATTQSKQKANSLISKEIASTSKNCNAFNSNSNFPISNILTTKNALIKTQYGPMASHNFHSNHVPTLNKPNKNSLTKYSKSNKWDHSTPDPSVNSKAKPNFGLRNGCIINSPLLAMSNSRQISRDLNSNFSSGQPLSIRSSNTPNLIRDQNSFKENQVSSIRGSSSSSESESFHSSPNYSDMSSESLAKYFKKSDSFHFTPLSNVKHCNSNLMRQMRLPILKNECYSNSIQSKNANVLNSLPNSSRNFILQQSYNKYTPNINPMALNNFNYRSTFNKPIDYNMYNKRTLIPQAQVQFLYNNSQRNVLQPQTVRKHNFIGVEVVDPKKYIRKHESELINNSQLPNLDITKWVELNKNDILPSNARLVSKKLKRV
jgi:hypothetical protein